MFTIARDHPDIQLIAGKVHYTEWLAATMKPSTLATDKAIKQAQ